jgi:hypothetical protein
MLINRCTAKISSVLEERVCPAIERTIDATFQQQQQQQPVSQGSSLPSQENGVKVTEHPLEQSKTQKYHSDIQFSNEEDMDLKVHLSISQEKKQMASHPELVDPKSATVAFKFHSNKDNSSVDTKKFAGAMPGLKSSPTYATAAYAKSATAYSGFQLPGNETNSLFDMPSKQPESHDTHEVDYTSKKLKEHLQGEHHVHDKRSLMSSGVPHSDKYVNKQTAKVGPKR